MNTLLISQDDLNIVTLEEVMEHSRIDDNYDELVVQGCLSAAHSLVESWLKRKLSPATVLGVQECFKTKVYLPYAPLTGVNSISALNDSYVSIDLVEGTDFRVDLVRSLVIFSDECEQLSEFQINYTCGYADLASVPDAVKHAIKMTSATLYENREDDIIGVSTTQVSLTAQRILRAFKAPNFA
jgi:hypothetical protein